MDTKTTLTIQDHAGETIFMEVFTCSNPWHFAVKAGTIHTGDAFLNAWLRCYAYTWRIEQGSRVLERTWHRKPVQPLHPFDEPALLVRALQKQFTERHLRLLRLLDRYTISIAAPKMGYSVAGAKKALERIYYLFTNEGNHTLTACKCQYRQVIYWLKHGELMPAAATV